MKYKRVQINITEDQNDKLEQLKQARGGSKSFYVRDALKNYFHREVMICKAPGRRSGCKDYDKKNGRCLYQGLCNFQNKRDVKR